MKARLQCADTEVRPHSDNLIIVYSKLLELTFRSRWPDTKILNLCEVPIDESFSDLTGKLEQLLWQLTASDSQFDWAPLAFRRVQYGLLFYKQFKTRFSLLAKEYSIREISMSSPGDVYLRHAVQSVCSQNSISLRIEQGDYEKFTSIEGYVSANDLEGHDQVDPPILVRMRQALSGSSSAKTLYQPYWNLPAFHDAAPVRHSDFFLMDKISKGLKHKFEKQQLTLCDARFEIKTSAVTTKSSDFSVDELQVIDALLSRFREQTSPPLFRSLHNSMKSYMTNSKAKQLILLDAHNPFSKMLAIAAKQSNKVVSFLPHGLTCEDYFTPSPRKLISRALAWNASSAQRFRSIGQEATHISHPHIKPPLEILRRANWKNILVLPNNSHFFRPMQLEHDLVSIASSIGKMGNVNLHFKLHPASQQTLELRNNFIAKLEERIQQKIIRVPSDQKLTSLLKSYDLAIVCGSGTAILESIYAGCPVLCYQPLNFGCFDGFNIPSVQTTDQLIEALNNQSTSYPYDSVEAFYNSFLSGPRFDSIL